MRTTVRIDDDLLRELKSRAIAEKVPITKLINQAIRQGMASRGVRHVRYRERVFSLGAPFANLDKALALAAADEDEHAVRKLAARK
ncbi:MAG TPA: ribbon-helix-helix protein, CopG family [Pirellulales bacterium]|jgi:hypothetical protein|nr:ribbon-helix-helix protein, CopG family [Pirellulales bacterium]